MPEILTESFCERCGTRYTFESAAPRAARLKGLKVVSRGLKNFVLSDDSSLDEAMAAARSDTDREVTSQQLDAFHKTFNFCMSCRQYTCANCWNEADGRCLSCAPHLGHEIMPAPFPDLDTAAVAMDAHGNGNGAEDHGANGHAAGAAMLAWPTSDLLREDESTIDDEIAADGLLDIPEIDAVARLAALDAVADDIEPEAATEVEAVPEVEAVAEAITEAPEASTEPVIVEDAPAPAAAAAAIEAPEAIAPDVETTADAASAQTTDLLQRFRPGQSLDAAIEEFERDRVAAEDAAATAALAAAAAASDAEPDAPVADVAATPAGEVDDDAGLAAAAIAAAAAAAAAARVVDDIEQPTWQIVAPENATAPTTDPAPAPTIPSTPVAPPQPTAPPVQTGEPQWPAAPEWPSHQSAGLPQANRPAATSLDSLWAESAREVATVAAIPAAGAAAKTGVQPCVSCGLSLSATARFCRRCGTRQG